MIRLKTLLEQFKLLDSDPKPIKKKSSASNKPTKPTKPIKPVKKQTAKTSNKVKNKTTTKPVDKKIVDKPIEPVTKTPETPIEQQPSNNIIFVSGVTTSVSGTPPKSVSQQQELLAKNTSMPIDAYYHGNAAKVIKAVTQNPTATVVLFSAGCSLASSVVRLMKDPTKLYIVEPYAISGTTTKSVRFAVEKGTPAANVFVGPSVGRGKGVVSGATKSVDNPKIDYMANHWKALEDVGKYIK